MPGSRHMHKILTTATLVAALLASSETAQASGSKRGHRTGGNKPGHGQVGKQSNQQIGQGNKIISGMGDRIVGQDATVKDYHLVHGQQFSKGLFFKGQDHKQWTHESYLEKHKCKIYYDPG